MHSPPKVFISHAVEDKKAITDNLNKALSEAGLDVWYSSAKLKPGDKMAETINKAIIEADFGIIVFSPNFTKAKWALSEAEALIAQETEGLTTIIPVWHNIAPDTVTSTYPLLVGKYGHSSSLGIDPLAKAIVDVINQKANTHFHLEAKKKNRRKHSVIGGLSIGALVIALGSYFAFFDRPPAPKEHFIIESIKAKIDDYTELTESVYQGELKSRNGSAVHLDSLRRYWKTFSEIEAKYRNHYEFSDGDTSIRFRKNLIDLGIKASPKELNRAFGFDTYATYLLFITQNDSVFQTKFYLKNLDSLSFEIIETKFIEDSYEVVVNVNNNIRLVAADFNYSGQTDFFKIANWTYTGFLPNQLFRFRYNESLQEYFLVN